MHRYYDLPCSDVVERSLDHDTKSAAIMSLTAVAVIIATSEVAATESEAVWRCLAVQRFAGAREPHHPADDRAHSVLTRWRERKDVCIIGRLARAIPDHILARNVLPLDVQVVADD